MAHPELELISNIVDRRDLATVKKLGVTPGFFRTEDGKLGFKFLWAQYHDLKTAGEVPDKARFLRKFPQFDWCASRNSMEALIQDLREIYLRKDLERVLEEMQDKMADDESSVEVLETGIKKLRDLHVRGAEDDGELLSDSVDAMRAIYDTRKRSGGLTGIPYPWAPLNLATGGLQPEQFVIIYGRAKNMKSWVACAIAAEAYIHRRRVIVYSKELSRENMRERVASILARVDYLAYQRGLLSEEEEEHFFEFLAALKDLEEDPSNGGRSPALLFLSDKGHKKASTVDTIAAKAERFDPDLIVVDGFYLLSDSSSTSKTSGWESLTNISRALKSMAQYLRCAVLGTSQANRSHSSGPSTDGDDFSYADALAQDTDLALRCFKGPNPTGKGALIMLYPSVVRDAVLNPFTINAWPGADFSLAQSSVNVREFMRAKVAAEKGEDDEDSGGKPPPKKMPKGFR